LDFVFSKLRTFIEFSRDLVIGDEEMVIPLKHEDESNYPIHLFAPNNYYKSPEILDCVSCLGCLFWLYYWIDSLKAEVVPPHSISNMSEMNLLLI
jgi:hypothetical protein